MSKRVVVASGYFNPLHYGHVSFLEKARDAGTNLVVIVNNDGQAARRLGGQAGFQSHGMPARDRVRLIRSLTCVDAAVECIDEDDSVCETLMLLHPDVFANGGKRTATQKEAAVCRRLGIEMIDGLGVELLLLQPFTQHYEWGKRRSESAVAALTGENKVQVEDCSTKFAELWMGDHPSGPSKVKSQDGAVEVTLGSALSSSPTILGPQLAEVGQLPFLLKVLSIHKALSIQAHPDRALAARLHQEYPQYYKDANHKPEIAIALTDFEALCGFRAFAEFAQLVEDVPELRSLIGDDAVETVRSASGDPCMESIALKAAYSHMMRTSDEVVQDHVRRLVERARKSPPEKGELPSRDCLATIFMLVERLHAQFGEDVGIFSLFFLNYVKMKVGDCLYMPQNTPHAYLSGDIVECMACSDNVVRGGLTPKFKHIDVLCEMLDYSGGLPPCIRPSELGPGIILYGDEALGEFQVTHVCFPGRRRQRLCFSNDGPALGFVWNGEGSLTHSGENVALRPGVVFLLAAGVEADLEAAAGEETLEVFVACCPPQYFGHRAASK